MLLGITTLSAAFLGRYSFKFAMLKGNSNTVSLELLPLNFLLLKILVVFLIFIHLLISNMW